MCTRVEVQRGLFGAIAISFPIEFQGKLHSNGVQIVLDYYNERVCTWICIV